MTLDDAIFGTTTCIDGSADMDEGHTINGYLLHYLGFILLKENIEYRPGHTEIDVNGDTIEFNNPWDYQRCIDAAHNVYGDKIGT